ncbi:hypothetical protein DRJ22_06390, partial [Candidatus Woesearchaeota archaeon]
DGDTVYIFNNWDDAGAIVHDIGPITGPVERTANYDVFQANLSITLAPVIPFEWHLDTIPQGETREMSPSESLKVVNIGNVPCDLGLYVQAIVPPGWSPSYYSGHDKFTLLCEFNDEMYPPTTFSPIRDYVKSTITWADDETFGPGGVNVLPPPYIEPDSEEHLWLKFIAPSYTTVFTEVRITLQVKAKYHMP